MRQHSSFQYEDSALLVSRVPIISHILPFQSVCVGGGRWGEGCGGGALYPKCVFMWLV